jgi:integrase
MSVYRQKGKKFWIMDFVFHAQRIRESTGTRSKTLAKRIESKRRRGLEEGSAGIRKPEPPRLLSVAANDWLDMKKPAWSLKMLVIEKTNLGHLLPELGSKLVCDIDARDVARYQQKRLEEGASPKTVNLEMGTLRAILKRNGQWARLQPDVRMLPTRDDVGRAITAGEERALLDACGKSRSRSLLPFVTLAIDTGARFNVIRTLQWANINFVDRCVQFGKDKTPSGTGRIIPLNPRAVATLTFWASNFPDREPEHCVFPAEKYGAAGDKFQPKTYKTDPTQPLGDIKEAWEAAKVRAGKMLKGIPDAEQPQEPQEGDTKATQKKGQPFVCRFHDLRHTAVSRMLDAGVPIAKVAKIVGWSPATMVRMAARYGHFNLEELRDAMDSISRAETPQGYPPIPPPQPDTAEPERAN